MGQAKQYFLHSHQSNSKMKAHQEEKNTLNSPPNKHYEWSFCIVLLEESLHPCLLLDASCSHCIGNTPWGEAGSCSQNSPCWASDSDHHQYLPATAKPQLTGPGKAASPRSDCNDRQSNSGQGTQGFHSPSFHNMQPHPHQPEVSHSTFRTVTSPKHKAGRRDGVGRGAAPSHLENKWVQAAMQSRAVLLVPLVTWGCARAYTHPDTCVPGTSTPLPLLLAWALGVPTYSSLQSPVLWLPGSNWYHSPHYSHFQQCHVLSFFTAISRYEQHLFDTCKHKTPNNQIVITTISRIGCQHLTRNVTHQIK